MRLKENANISDKYYIEAPEDVDDIEKFDDAVTDMSLVTPESNFFDFDNIFLASVSQIRTMIEDYGVEPVVYESFDEENGPSERIYDVYSLAFDADPLDECVCAGQACGTGTISDFVPEKMRGVKDIHEKDDKFAESNTYEAFHPYEGFEADVGFWYGEYCKDVDAGLNNPDVGIAEYIAEKIDEEHPTKNFDQFKSLVRLVRETYPKAEKNRSSNIHESRIGGAKIQKERLIKSFKKVMETKEVPAENPNNYFYGKAEKNIEYSKVNPDNMKVNKKLPENKKIIPRAMRESRALPGGMLNSEEKTAYEDFLREKHLKQDKVKAKEFGKNKLGLYDDECGENGWHNWDGTKIK